MQFRYWETPVPNVKINWMSDAGDGTVSKYTVIFYRISKKYNELIKIDRISATHVLSVILLKLFVAPFTGNCLHYIRSVNICKLMYVTHFFIHVQISNKARKKHKCFPRQIYGSYWLPLGPPTQKCVDVVIYEFTRKTTYCISAYPSTYNV